MRRYNFLAVTACLAGTLLFSCDDTTDEPSYEVPDTYAFDNVDYSGQEARIDMLAEISALAKAGNKGEFVDAAILKDMFANENEPFESAALNTNTKNLKSKTFDLDVELIESFFDKQEKASLSAGATGSNGQAGLVTSNDGNKTYLFDENGYEYAQFIEKVIMGACFYYQTLGTYMTDARIGEGVDNLEVEEGKGTAMEHHWDEGFGYLSLPTNYPNNVEPLEFWAKYIDGRNEILGTGDKLMAAFIEGRAAISAKDMDTKNLMRDIVYKEFELVSAATAIHYINAALAGYADDAIRNHALSEAWAFSQTLQYNPNKSISTAEVIEIRDLLGDNFYTVSRADLVAAKTALATAFKLSAEADNL